MIQAVEYEVVFTNLPFQLTNFIGREPDLKAVEDLLSAARLVTITGPGGVGKTSLALHIAYTLDSTFVDGAHFISLASTSNPTLIIPTIAQSLGLAEPTDRLLFDRLKDFLRHRQILLLVDNFEHVISTAPLLSELLLATRELKLLVTSREALHVRGEQEYPLAPFELSDRLELSKPPPVEELLRYSSIALFVQRAQASQPNFRLTAENAAAVVEICRRLDGLPLAIELAAARIKVLPPQRILEQIQASALELLAFGARDAPPRQQTLQLTIQWSYDLLNFNEQQAFRCLSAFVAGSTLDAAASVIGQLFSRNNKQDRKDDDRSLAVLDHITALVNKSLLIQTTTDGEPRLSMLETIREFGTQQLDQTNELEAVQRTHSQYFLSFAEKAAPQLTGREQKAWLTRLSREKDNLLAALRWGFDHHDADFTLRLVVALWQYWHMRGQWGEGRRWLEEALALASKVEVKQALLAKTLHAAATLIRYQYDFTRARSLCEQSIALYRALDDKVGLLTSLLQLGRILDYQGDHSTRALLPEMIALAEELPDLPIKAQFYSELHLLIPDSIRSGMAIRYLAQSERIYSILDDPDGIAKTLLFQSVIAEHQGDIAQARLLRDRAGRMVTAVEDQHLRLVIQSGQAVSAWQSGDYASARKVVERLLFASRELDASSDQKILYLGQRNMFLGILAAVLHGQGMTRWAARVYGLADKLAPTSESPRMGGELFDAFRRRVAAARAEVRDRLGEDDFAQALAEGLDMNMEDLLAIPHPPQASPTRAASSFPFEPLTSRELSVLRLLEQDLSNSQIAERLTVSRRTVDAHLRSIYAKLGVRSRDAAVHIAGEYGLI